MVMIPKKDDILKKMVKANQGEIEVVAEAINKLITEATILPVFIPREVLGNKIAVRKGVEKLLNAGNWVIKELQGDWEIQ